MSIFQIIALLFALFMTYVVFIHGKKKTLSFWEVSFWATIWIAFGIVALFPSLLLGLSEVLNFSRVFDLLTVLAFMILSLLLFLSYFRQKETTRKVEDLTREMAIYKLADGKTEQSKKP